jgi:plastocyanin
MRRLIVLFLVLGAVAAAPAALGATTSVSITRSGFHASQVTVAAGDTVTWTNNDTLRHQVVADDGSFSSPVLTANQTYSHVFKTGGTFAYHDGVHPSLHGSVTVIPVRTVWITSSGFRPPTMSIKATQKVTWTNKDSANHQIVADDGTFSSPVLAPGQSYTHAFPVAGSFGYHDGLQASVKGTVVVAALAAPKSLSLESSTTVVTYGASLELTGTVTNVTAPAKVTITAHPQIVAKGVQAVETTTVTTAADGSFTATVHPLAHTTYVAETGTTRSEPLAINVRPRLQLAKLSHDRELLRVTAARSFLRKWGVLQRWNARRGVWSSLRRVVLTRVTAELSPDVTTVAVFRAHVRRHSRLRVLMPLRETVPAYVSGVSNILRR